MSNNETDYREQLEKEIQEINQQIRMMIKVCIYTSFVLLLITTITVIIRGFEHGFM